MGLGGSDPRKTVQLLEKGRENCKDYWKVPFVAGYVYYFQLGDAERAAGAMEDAARLKPFPPWALLASRMRAERGNYELSISFLSQMLTNIDDPAQKKQFEERIAEWRAKIMERELTAQAREYQRREGRAPGAVQDLETAGIRRSAPVHPLRGRRFVYDPSLGGFRSEPPVETGVFVP
jgi:hypothetical protein